jgi:hypothetical protein
VATIIPAIVPLVLKDLDFIVGALVAGAPSFDDGINFKKHVDQAAFTPSTSTQTWTNGAGETFTDTSTATWTVGLSYGQDWDDEDSLSNYLLEHEGERVPVKFQPRSGTGPSFTSIVTITPGAIGGQVNAYATTTVTLGSTKPAKAA